jgi:ATP-dependent DNA helicase RecG
MAPTELLARQHYKTFKGILEKYGVEIELVTGSAKTKKENASIVIGTHALLHKKEKTPGVSLIVIDEQHRFGVEQRSQIIKMYTDSKKPHLLTMTATPIPRTLALTLYGDLNLTVLDENPNKNKKITTRVVPEKLRNEAYEWIKNKNDSTFIVCPLIDESASESLENVKAATTEYNRLGAEVFKDVPMGLLHGRMKSKEKQEVIEKFESGEIKVLVSTPVIEVGIDIPEASVMVIESAERYGLASLHQLRGRVGRGKKEGFCLVFMSNNSQAGYKRLKNLESIQSGLKLAEVDMELRGQGDIFGTMQHGIDNFKVADITDLELLEKTKVEAQKYFAQIKEYPLLKKHVEEIGGKLVENN